MGDWNNLYQDKSPDLPNVGLVGYGYLNNLIKSFNTSSYHFQKITPKKFSLLSPFMTDRSNSYLNYF